MRNFIGEYIRRGMVKEEKIGFDQVIKHVDRARVDRVSDFIQKENPQQRLI